ncbi:4-oxalocrotonate decarboxylase [Embleya scabrispora]|uniref:4-oxalocrotonate decarboxylase n=1 Tax=Embleya scabrispora TaxID=159449 RepID=A0A1T3NUF1_9ACTN|nr:fumarylacetoacetate hydrolase family protein [Embleya scabrispora]OPC80310.1 4-oxalocrotonate decarboxylase [Embleya scabrispora]
MSASHDADLVAAFAARLDEAALAGRTAERPTDTADLDPATAYRVQRAVIERRIARGEATIGVKMGFTSRAKMIQMGVDDVIWGLLTDAMLIEEGGVLDTAGLIQPRIEPEIAFLIGRPLSGEVTPAEAVRAVAGVAVAYEVLDSRYADFAFTLPDVIADNASAAGFGVGPWQDPGAVDPANLGLLVEIDGRPVATGSSAAILGNPLRSLIAAARLAAGAGLELRPGWIVLAGAATAALPLPKGVHVRVSAAGLGRAEVSTR